MSEPWPLDADGKPVPALPNGWPDLASVNWPHTNGKWATIGSDGRPVVAIGNAAPGKPLRRRRGPMRSTGRAQGWLPLVILAVLVAVVAVIGESVHNTDTKAAPPIAEDTFDAQPLDVPPVADEPPTNWWPSGFTPTNQDSDIAYKYVPVASVSCGDTGLGCFQMHIAVNESCNSLYIEMSTLNSAGEKIGFTNDTLSGMNPGDRGLMTFPITEQGPVKGQISEVDCL